jgi:hypothetical protein
MEKPTVFLSHSSLDKEPLAVLKRQLDDRAAGSLNFFLSSDGESIRFGRNWVVRISDALAKAKLMFVFLSPKSVDSKWIHFEAGCAYAKEIQVVPVCLPGIDLNRITPPLSLLQGFNLHSFGSMGNLSRICNEVFAMKMNESFSEADFDSVMSSSMTFSAGVFGDLTWAINAVSIESETKLPPRDSSSFSGLRDICQKARITCHPLTGHRSGLEMPGCEVTLQTYSYSEQVSVEGGKKKNIQKEFSRVHCELSPELFHLNAPVLEEWFQSNQHLAPLVVKIKFADQITCEKQRQRFTSKLHQCGINLLGNSEFEFETFRFQILKPLDWVLEFQTGGKLLDERLPRLLAQLFRASVMWEVQPDLSEMFQAS